MLKSPLCDNFRVCARREFGVNRLRPRIGAFIHDAYSGADRLNSALGCKSPLAFERQFHKTQTEERRTTVALSLSQRVSRKGCSPPYSIPFESDLLFA